MEIYRLTGLGESLSHNTRAPDNAKWRVLFYLARNGAKSGEEILENVPEASRYTLGQLKSRHIIMSNQGVTV
jgi:hypothetical protein